MATNASLTARLRSYALVTTTAGGRTTQSHQYLGTWWAALTMTLAAVKDLQQKSAYHTDGTATFTDGAILDVRSVIRDEFDGAIYKCIGLLPRRPSVGWIQMKVSLVNESQGELANLLLGDPAPTW